MWSAAATAPCRSWRRSNRGFKGFGVSGCFHLEPKLDLLHALPALQQFWPCSKADVLPLVLLAFVGRAGLPCVVSTDLLDGVVVLQSARFHAALTPVLVSTWQGCCLLGQHGRDAFIEHVSSNLQAASSTLFGLSCTASHRVVGWVLLHALCEKLSCL